MVFPSEINCWRLRCWATQLMEQNISSSPADGHLCGTSPMKMEVSIVMRIPQNGWFIVENPMSRYLWIMILIVENPPSKWTPPHLPQFWPVLYLIARMTSLLDLLGKEMNPSSATTFIMLQLHTEDPWGRLVSQDSQGASAFFSKARWGHFSVVFLQPWWHWWWCCNTQRPTLHRHK